MEKVVLMLGGNLGNIRETFDFAVEQLVSGGFVLLSRSGAESSAPVDCLPGTPDFLDEAVIGSWEGTPFSLLELAQTIERRAGRPAVHSSCESRTLDIDLILFGSRVIRSPQLTVPHPRAQQRLFVLNCLQKLDPELRFPDSGLSVKELLSRLEEQTAGGKL